MANYLLLRDNKETGPYTMDELVKLGLKAYDLVWIQGKSAAWRYPSEIAELKPYAPAVEEQPFDRFYKKPAATSAHKTSVEGTVPTNSIPREYEAYIPKAKVSDRPSAKRKIFVTMPSQAAEKKVDTNPVQIAKPAIAAIPDYTQPEIEETISITEKPVARIKYSQPLDEIKEMYVKTLKDRKVRLARKNILRTNLKRAAVVLGLVGIGALAGFILRSKPAANNQLAQQLPAITAPAILNDQPATNDKANYQEDPAPESLPIDQLNQIKPGSSNNRIENRLLSHEESVQEPIINERKPARNTFQQEDNSSLQKETKETRKPLAVMPPPETRKQQSYREYSTETDPVTGERKRTVRTNGAFADEQLMTETTGKSQPNNETSAPDALSGLGDKVTVVSNDYKRVALGGIRNLELTVRNNSKYDLDEVSVELQYLKPGDQVLKTQMVHFKSVPANESETLRIPDTNRGIKVQFRIVRIGGTHLAER